MVGNLCSARNTCFTTAILCVVAYCSLSESLLSQTRQFDSLLESDKTYYDMTSEGQETREVTNNNAGRQENITRRLNAKRHRGVGQEHRKGRREYLRETGKKSMARATQSWNNGRDEDLS